LDEIPIGLGRTGRFFAFEHYDVVPDMVVLGKGLGGGILPIAALLARDGLNVAAERALGHYTHEKNPVACAAGLATLQVIDEEDLVRWAEQLGALALSRLEGLRERHDLVGEVRGLGLLLGVELLQNQTTEAPANAEAERVMYSALRRGLNFKVTQGNLLTLTPPLTLTDEELDEALGMLDAALSEVGANPVVGAGPEAV
jgi:4-aminobutyrate aminotransferase